ncbi:MAG: glycine cleavage system protein R [Desulfohalobiaceae bacterium]
MARREYIISAVGGNRPGVVAEVSKQIYLSGSKIVNSSMTLLAEHFSLMIHISAEEGAVQDWLSPLLRELQERSEITAHIFAVPESQPSEAQAAGQRYALRIRGVDRSGIVYKTSSFLARKGVNILDMDTRLEQGPLEEVPVFRMYTLIEVPEESDTQAFRSELESLASDLQESVSLSKVQGQR